MPDIPIPTKVESHNSHCAFDNRWCRWFPRPAPFFLNAYQALAKSPSPWRVPETQQWTKSSCLAACQSQLHDWGRGTRRLAARHWSWVADLLRCPWGQASLPTLCEGWGWISLSCQTMLEMNVIHQWNESLGPVALAWHSGPAPGPVFLLHLINCKRYVFQWFHRGQTPPVIMGENGSVEKFPEKDKRMKNSYLRGTLGGH